MRTERLRKSAMGWRRTKDLLSVLRKLLDRGIWITWTWRFGACRKMEQPPPLLDVMTVERLVFTDKSTLGDICFDGKFFCHCLELSCRKGDEGGRRAIPTGRFEIKMTYSPKFKRETAEVMNVPGRTGIRFHPANYSSQLDGCIASGYRTGVDSIFDSVKANDALHEEIRKRLKDGPLFVSFIGGYH